MDDGWVWLGAIFAVELRPETPVVCVCCRFYVLFFSRKSLCLLVSSTRPIHVGAPRCKGHECPSITDNRWVCVVCFVCCLWFVAFSEGTFVFVVLGKWSML